MGLDLNYIDGQTPISEEEKRGLRIKSIFGKEVFSWGRSNLVKSDNLRKDYINSLKEADNGLINSLIKFARK